MVTLRFMPSRVRMWPRVWSWLLLSALVALSSSPVQADQRPWTLDLYRHMSWTGKSGAPTGVAALAQAKNGYLRVEADHGLYRFDGNTFEQFNPTIGEPLQSAAVTALFAPREGGLWVGYEDGGVSFLKDGRVSNYKPELPQRKTVLGFTEEDGVVGGTVNTEEYHWFGAHAPRRLVDTHAGWGLPASCVRGEKV